MTTTIQTTHVVICGEWAEVWCRGVKVAQRAHTNEAYDMARDLAATAALFHHRGSPVAGRN